MKAKIIMKIRFEEYYEDAMDHHRESELFLGKPTDVDHDLWIPYEYEYNRESFEDLLKNTIAKGNCWFEIMIESPRKTWIDWQDDLHEMVICSPKRLLGEFEWQTFASFKLNNSIDRENALSYLFGFLAGISTLENESKEGSEIWCV